MGFTCKSILHKENRKIKTKDIILIIMEIFKVKSDTIYTYIIFIFNIFFKSIQLIKLLSRFVLIMT